jgi:hypothetical protein
MLDLNRVAGQISTMVDQLKTGAGQHRENLEQAIKLMQLEPASLAELKRKAALSAGKTTFLVAGLVDPLDAHFSAPATPADFTILATDGSQIDVDRHQSARCYLINIGRVRLDYGSHPDAVLENIPRLYANDKDMVISSGTKEQNIESQLLGICRSIEELRHLVMLAAEVSQPALALIDGSLILWALAGKEYQDFVLEELLDRGYLKHLQAMQALGQQKTLALASYISFPRSTDVVNVLRLALCPHAIADCDRYCRELAVGKRPCDSIAGVQDRDIFSKLLADGARSALFQTQSRIVEKRYATQRIHFFYLKTSEEIARVEVPEWVAANQGLLELTHSLILDQCRRGQGYPVALSEAHEQVVVTAADRQSFQQTLEMWLTGEHIPVTTSVKSRSKKTRWV